jgi:hypothetical protein
MKADSVVSVAVSTGTHIRFAPSTAASSGE